MATHEDEPADRSVIVLRATRLLNLPRSLLDRSALIACGLTTAGDGFCFMIVRDGVQVRCAFASSGTYPVAGAAAIRACSLPASAHGSLRAGDSRKPRRREPLRMPDYRHLVARCRLRNKP